MSMTGSKPNRSATPAIERASSLREARRTAHTGDVCTRPSMARAVSFADTDSGLYPPHSRKFVASPDVTTPSSYLKCHRRVPSPYPIHGPSCEDEEDDDKEWVEDVVVDVTVNTNCCLLVEFDRSPESSQGMAAATDQHMEIKGPGDDEEDEDADSLSDDNNPRNHPCRNPYPQTVPNLGLRTRRPEPSSRRATSLNSAAAAGRTTSRYVPLPPSITATNTVNAGPSQAYGYSVVPNPPPAVQQHRSRTSVSSSFGIGVHIPPPPPFAASRSRLSAADGVSQPCHPRHGCAAVAPTSAIFPSRTEGPSAPYTGTRPSMTRLEPDFESNHSHGVEAGIQSGGRREQLVRWCIGCARSARNRVVKVLAAVKGKEKGARN